MTLSKTGVLTGLVLFFAIISIFVGMYESSNNTELSTTGETNVNSGSVNFFNNIITGYTDLPPVFNLMFFGTLITIFLWVVITSVIPTLDGGS